MAMSRCFSLLHLSISKPSLNLNLLPWRILLSRSSCSCCDSPSHIPSHNNTPKSAPTKNTLVNFSLSSDDDDDDIHSGAGEGKSTTTTELPPPYDPFNNKTPAIKEPDDPKNLQEIFHNMRSSDGGLLNNAVKMFDGLSKQGLTHEALELFAQIKDKGQMPEVVAHTAVVEAYANAGQSKKALKVFNRMLACGVAPNAYTYSVLIKGLATEAKMLPDAGKFVVEMMGKGMKPDAAMYTTVLEGFLREEKVDKARELVEKMKEKGFVVADDEKVVREAVHNKRGPVFRTLINLLFDK